MEREPLKVSEVIRWVLIDGHTVLLRRDTRKLALPTHILRKDHARTQPLSVGQVSEVLTRNQVSWNSNWFPHGLELQDQEVGAGPLSLD